MVENLVSIKTYKVSDVDLQSLFSQTRTIAELISCQSSAPIPVMCVPKGH